MEIEAKFIVPHLECFEQLRQLDRLGEYQLSAEVRRDVRDRYIDTSDRRLLAAGFACRYRRQGDNVQVTLKGLGSSQNGIHRRVELECQLPAEQHPTAWPSGEPREHVLAIAGESPLQPLFELSQTRLKRRVSLEERVVAEWSLDEVRLNSAGHETRYFELEIEQLPDGTEDELAVLARQLQIEWSLQPEPRSKFERALALVDESSDAARVAPQIELLSSDSMAEAARKVLLFQFQQIQRHEPATRAGDVMALHDMRVATRRMRTAFRVFKANLNQKSFTAYNDIVYQLAGLLGAVRDLDVFWEAAENYLSVNAATAPEDLTLLKVIWAKHHQVARMALLDYLDGADYQLFVETFAALLSDVDNFPQDTATQEIRQVLPLILQKQVEKILSYEEEASSLNPSPSNLHQLRIACKRLRYTLEYFQTLFDPPVEALITMIKGMQDHLGQLQDAVVAGEMLKLYLIWGDWGEAATRRAYWADEPVIDPGTAQYLAWRQTECQNLLETFPQLWQQFKESEFQQTLDSALKGL